jgi:diguanylate cyclase (GGDEF)-like protein
MRGLDHFEQANGNLGHAAGNRALRCVARALQSSLRAGGVVGRLGGEEFCRLISHADEAGARAHDRRLHDLGRHPR